jgi:alkanesulfonate monooxygenase SsuD/methylene tetrahydromethanopterin reductase-like flavin-dependent oxidoreductase (luciferase family)
VAIVIGLFAPTIAAVMYFALAVYLTIPGRLISRLLRGCGAPETGGSAVAYDGSMPRPLRVGVQLPEVEREVRWPELLDMARAADDLGYDAVWVGEHLLYRFADGESRGPWEAWTLMAALAAVTTRTAIGPLVACTNFHNPALLAKQAATIDEIAGGRFVLGLGAGWNEAEFRAFGFPYDRRIARFEEAFTIVRTLLREGYVDFDGEFYQARDCELKPRGPSPTGPPLMIGSIGPRMLRIAAPHVQAWNAWYADTDNTPGGLAPLRKIVDAACVDSGVDPAAIERTAAVLVQFPGGTGRAMGDTSERQDVAPLTGSPAAMATAMRAYAEAGMAEVQLVMDPISRASIEEFARVLRLLDDDRP